jgi:hypothetical protein
MKPPELTPAKRVILQLLQGRDAMTTAEIAKALSYKRPGPVHLHCKQMSNMAVLVAEKPNKRPDRFRYGPSPTLWRLAEAETTEAA